MNLQIKLVTYIQSWLGKGVLTRKKHKTKVVLDNTAVVSDGHVRLYNCLTKPYKPYKASQGIIGPYDALFYTTL